MGNEKIYFFVALRPGERCNDVLMTMMDSDREALMHLLHLKGATLEVATEKLRAVYGVVSLQAPEPLGAVVYERKTGGEVVTTEEAEVYLLPRWETLPRENGMKVTNLFPTANLPVIRREDEAWVERAVSGKPGFHYTIPMVFEPNPGSGAAPLPAEIS